jgi:hypothetical protein
MGEISTTTYTPAEIRASGDEAGFPTTNVTLASTQTAITAGTILGIVGASGLAVAYDDQANDGSEVAVGVLATNADPATEGRAIPVPMYIGGQFVASKLTGLDAGAIADLHGISMTNGIFKF